MHQTFYVRHLIYVDRAAMTMRDYTAKYGDYRHDARTYAWGSDDLPYHRLDGLSCPMHLPPGGDPAKEHQDFQRDVVGFVYMSAKFWSADFAHAVQVPHRLQPFFYNKSMKQQHIGVHKPSVPLSVMEELYSHLLSISAKRDSLCKEHPDDG